jgi:hypothetical protein
MKLVSAVAVAIACQLMTVLPLTPVDAQSSTATDNERSVAFGDTQIVLHAPSQHCLLDPSQSADQRLAALFFQPRAGTLNTYLGAFLDCKSLAALRSSGPNQVQLSSYAYYLAFTARATDPITTPRDLVLQRVCDNARAKNGALDLAEQNARSEIEVRMNALPSGKPWFGPVVAQDGNGCYQIVLYKSLAQGIETREALVTIVTFVKRRQLTFTRAVPYSSDGLSSFVRMVQSEAAAFVELNP